jgi:hypothetical protein
MNRPLKIMLGSFVTLLVAAFAAWAIWNAAAGARLRAALAAIEARGWPTTLEAFRPPPVPDAENAAPILNRAFLEMAGGNTKFQPLSPPFAWLAEQWNSGTNLAAALRDDPSLAAEVRARLEAPEVAGAIALLRQAAARPHCNFDLDYSQGAALVLPHVSILRSAVRLLCAKACVEALAGNAREALAILRDAFALSAMAKEDRILISLLVSVACESTVIESLSVTLAQAPAGSWTAADLEALSAMFERERAGMRQALLHSADGERLALGGWAYEGILHGSLDLGSIDTMGGPDESARPPLRRLLTILVRPLIKADYAVYLSIMADMRELFAKPYDAAASKGFRQRIENMPRWAILCSLIMPALERVQVKTTEHECLLDAARVGLAMESHRLSTGAYPATLDELRLPGGVPADPFTGRPLSYRRTDSGVLVYGFGQDGEDNEGLHRSGGDGPYDVTWEVPR